MRSFMPRSASRIMRASKPAPAMTANRSPLTFAEIELAVGAVQPDAHGLGDVLRDAEVRREEVGGARRDDRDGASVPASASTVRCTMPSPPHTKTRSAPSSTTRRACFGACLLFGTSYQIGSVDALVGENVSAAHRDRRRATCGRARCTATVVIGLPAMRSRMSATRDGDRDAHDEQRRRAMRAIPSRTPARDVGREVHAPVQARNQRRRTARPPPRSTRRTRTTRLRTCVGDDQRDADVQHDGGRGVTRREARRRWRRVELLDLRTVAVDEERGRQEDGHFEDQSRWRGTRSARQ